MMGDVGGAVKRAADKMFAMPWVVTVGPRPAYLWVWITELAAPIWLRLRQSSVTLRSFCKLLLSGTAIFGRGDREYI